MTTYSLPEMAWWGEATAHININQSLLAFMREGRRRSTEYNAFIVRGSTGFSNRYIGQISAANLARRGLPTVLAECIWESSSRRLRLHAHTITEGVDAPPARKSLLAGHVISSLDHDRMHYCVLSEEERFPFAKRWNLPIERIYNTGYCATSTSNERHPETKLEVFSGGDSLRDYRPLVAISDQISAPVRIATRLIAARSGANTEIGWMSASDYEARSRAAAIIVVPLAAGLERSAGQQTYLNAMLSGKPVVVTDTIGVREHVEHGKTGLIVPPNDSDALRAALELLISNRALRQQLGNSARTHVLEHYTRDLYFKRLYDLACSVAE